MNQMETLKERIEEEREKLNRLALGDDLEATYRQSLVLDRLVRGISGPAECLKREETVNIPPQKWGDILCSI